MSHMREYFEGEDEGSKTMRLHEFFRQFLHYIRQHNEQGIVKPTAPSAPRSDWPIDHTILDLLLVCHEDNAQFEAMHSGIPIITVRLDMPERATIRLVIERMFRHLDEQ